MQSRLWRQIRSWPITLLTRPQTKDAWFFLSFEAYLRPLCVSNRCKDSFQRKNTLRSRALYIFSNHVNSPSQDFTHQHERDSTKVSQQNINVFADIRGITKGLWLSKHSFKNRLFRDKITQKKKTLFYSCILLLYHEFFFRGQYKCSVNGMTNPRHTLTLK